MSQEKSTRHLLIIDPDLQLLALLQQHFAGLGYQVDLASTGEDGLAMATANHPDLILLSAQMPGLSGLDVFRELRDRPRTGHIPVMILAGQQEAMLQNQILEEGVYDVIEKPVDVDILALRVRNALRRAEREGLTEPRTGLPTGRLIDERLRALERERGWYRIDLALAGFDDFRDLYGFVTANEALRFAGSLVAQIVNEYGSPNDFVGHPNGSEEFVIVTTQAHGPRLEQVLAQRVTQEMRSFYNFMEREQGFVLAEDASGNPVQKPLMAARCTSSAGEPDPNAASGPAHADSVDTSWQDAETDTSLPQDDSSGGPSLEW
ncbi:MAG: response regulator [Chloroflexi bacterium]|nr:response regulator [Chloroflexota bacterium]